MTEIQESKSIVQTHFKCLFGSHLLASNWPRQVTLLNSKSKNGDVHTLPEKTKKKYFELSNMPLILDFFFLILLIIEINHNIIYIKNLLFINYAKFEEFHVVITVHLLC